MEKKDRRIAFAVADDGTTLNVQNGNKVVELDSRTFEGFEGYGWTLVEKNPTTLGLKIRYPRVTTSSGREFCLIQNANKEFVAEETPADFILIDPVKKILGELEGILCFQNPKTQEIKVLAPIRNVQSIFRPPSFAPHKDIALPSSKVDETGYYSIQKGGYSFAEYLYKKGQVIPKDRVARAFLAYIYVLQKKDLEAASILDSLGKDLPLTEKIEEILYWIYDPDRKSPNQTPARMAVSLKAALFLARKTEGFSIKGILNSYKAVYADIPIELRLTKKELKEISILYPDLPLSGKDHVVKEKGAWGKDSINLQDRLGFMYSSQKKMFYKVYQPIASAKSLQDRQIAITDLPLGFSDLPDKLKGIILYADRNNTDLPLLPSDSEEDIKALTLKEASISVLPKRIGLENKDLPLPKGAPLRSLDSILQEVAKPSQVEVAFRVKESKVLDLNTLFIKPYFRIVTKKQEEKKYSIPFPEKVDPMYKAT
ncbi:MAG: hypothetical protein JSS09_05810, partial [Verrucomicrobia bacterium]|nr:hypothetical protein [Verrucomicrobiota bacterium]